MRSLADRFLRGLDRVLPVRNSELAFEEIECHAISRPAILVANATSAGPLGL